MKKILTLAALIAITSFSTSVEAGEKFGVVDVAAVVQKSIAAQDVYKQVEDARNKLQEDVKKKEEDLRGQERELAKQRSIISKEAFEEKTKEFQKKMMVAQKDLQSRGAKLQKSFESAMEQIKDKMLNIIKNISKADNITMVAPKSSLLYAKDDAEITAKVIEKLNDSLKKITLDK